jgi:hypothetical protein
MNKVVIRSGLAHSLQAPVRGCGTGEFQNLFIRIFERSVRRFTTKRLATNLHKLSAHLVTSSCRAGIAIHLPGGEQDCSVDRGLK